MKKIIINMIIMVIFLIGCGGGVKNNVILPELPIAPDIEPTGGDKVDDFITFNYKEPSVGMTFGEMIEYNDRVQESNDFISAIPGMLNTRPSGITENEVYEVMGVTDEEIAEIEKQRQLKAID